MSSPTFDDSESSDLAQRVLAEFGSDSSKRNIAQLYIALNPPSLGVLQNVLSELMTADLLHAIIRVHSPFGEKYGLEDYESVFDIPKCLEDDDQDPPRTFEVGISNIEVLFSRRSIVDQSGR